MNQQAPTMPVLELESASPDEIVLRTEKVTKVYPGTIALDKVDFTVYSGKVNALVGENGAGKSTLMKILAGVEKPTSGRIFLRGREIHLRNVREAAAEGIGIIFQEMSLCPNLSVVDNIFLAREITNGVTVDREAQVERVRQLMRRLGQDIDPDALVGELRVGQQKIVEIARALAQDVSILIMDEPTAAMSNAEVETLFHVISELKSQGVSIIYISHKLEEIVQISDYVTVLRDGKVVQSARVADVSVPWIIERMVGKNPAALYTRRAHNVGEVLLKVEDLTLPRRGGGYLVDHVSFELHAGEVLGFYGLIGAGRSELAECLAGVRPEASGKIWLNGRLVVGTGVSQRIKTGIMLVPEDRQRGGVVLPMSVHDNIVLASLKKYLNKIYLVSKKERAAVKDMVQRLAIRVADVNYPVASLSGGNQQKCVIAKALLAAPKVLILDEPNHGIDVGAKSEIFEIISQLAEQGYGIIFISSELKEVMAISDRILVMSKGVITGEFSREEATEEKLVAASAVGHGPTGMINRNGRVGTYGYN